MSFPRTALALLAAGLLASVTLALGGCDVPGTGDVSPDDPVLAEIGGEAIRSSDVEARLRTMPRLARAEYATAPGRARLLDQMIEEDLLFRAAVDAGVEDEEAIRRELQDHRRRVLVQAYLDRAQQEMTRVSEDEIRAYYDAHADEYVTETEIQVRALVSADSTIAARAREMVTEGTIQFDDACNRFSDEPALVEARGLLPGWIRRDRAVPWIGNHPEFHAVAFSLPVGELSPLFHTAKGWFVVRVEEIREGRQRTFEESRSDIEGRLSRQKSTQGLPALLADLRERYGVVEYEPPGRSAEELFTRAQSESRPRNRVALYEELLERYPEDERAVEARFMLGFLLAEELGDREGAAVHFRRIIEEHPESELAESARWMLSSGGDGLPPAVTGEGSKASPDAPGEEKEP